MNAILLQVHNVSKKLYMLKFYIFSFYIKKTTITLYKIIINYYWLFLIGQVNISKQDLLYGILQIISFLLHNISFTKFYQLFVIFSRNALDI